MILAIASKGYFKEDDKGQCVMGIDFIMICKGVRSCKFYTKLFYSYTKSTRRPVTLQDVPLLNVTSASRPYAGAEVTILVQEYPDNYQK